MRLTRLVLLCTAVAISGGCSRFRHGVLPSFAVKPAASRPPSTASLASQYGCTAEQVAANWQTARLAIARPGTPICSVLGRYGEPVSVTKNAAADMELVSMLHREPNGRYYNATFVYYSDTKVNRQLKRPIGRWIVDRVTASR
jgi:hypothetical protein